MFFTEMHRRRQVTNQIREGFIWNKEGKGTMRNNEVVELVFQRSSIFISGGFKNIT